MDSGRGLKNMFLFNICITMLISAIVNFCIILFKYRKIKDKDSALKYLKFVDKFSCTLYLLLLILIPISILIYSFIYSRIRSVDISMIFLGWTCLYTMLFSLGACLGISPIFVYTCYKLSKQKF